MPHHHIKPAQFELFALSDKANAAEPVNDFETVTIAIY